MTSLGFLDAAVIEDAAMPARTWSKFSDAMLNQAAQLLLNTKANKTRITLAFPTIEERNEAASLFRVAAKRTEGVSVSFREDRNENGQYVLYAAGIEESTRKTDENRPRKPKRQKGESPQDYKKRLTAYLPEISKYLNDLNRGEEFDKINTKVKEEIKGLNEEIAAARNS